MSSTDSSLRGIGDIPGLSCMRIGEINFYLQKGRSFVVIGPSVINHELDPCGVCAALWRSDISGNELVFDTGDGGLVWRIFNESLTMHAIENLDRYRFAVKVVGLSLGEITSHTVRRHPYCGICHPVKDDIAQDFRDRLFAAHSAEGSTWRSRHYSRDELRNEFVDFRFGIIRHLSRDEASPLALTQADTVRPGASRIDGGYGRATDFSSSEIPAVIEGLERIQSAIPLGKRTRVVGSYDSVCEDAVNPRDLGLPDSVPNPGSRFVPFSSNTETSWVWGWSTREERPILVPEHVAYWDTARTAPAFVYESSNGSATGSSLQEAVFFGLLEVIERDAFLISWYNGHPLQEISVELPENLAITSDLLIRKGYSLKLLDITSDFSVPSCMAVIVGDDDEVEQGRARALNTAAGTHPDFLTAAFAALAEAATNALMYESWARRNPEMYRASRFRPMVADFDEIEKLDDHTGVFGLNEARPFWEFLRNSSPESMEQGSSFTQTEINRGLYFERLIERVHILGMDVIIVDQTAPYLIGNTKLSTVKVIVPGAIPMTFGHRNRRTNGFSRLKGDPSTRIPHPFP